jgi:hypothetical protein
VCAVLWDVTQCRPECMLTSNCAEPRLLASTQLAGSHENVKSNSSLQLLRHSHSLALIFLLMKLWPIPVAARSKA